MSGMIVHRAVVGVTDWVNSIVALTPVPAGGVQLDEATVDFFASVITDRQSPYDYFRMAIPKWNSTLHRRQHIDAPVLSQHWLQIWP